MKSKKTKMMGRFISINIAGIFFFIVCCCISCKGTNENLRILIQNRTDSTIYINLYPTTEYISASGIFYSISDDGSSGSTETKFSLQPNYGTNDWNEVIFISRNLDAKPYALVSEVFDSIYITLPSKDNFIIKFTPENVIGYSENIFSENSTWDFEIKSIIRPTQFRTMRGAAHCYCFLILEDRIIIE